MVAPALALPVPVFVVVIALARLDLQHLQGLGVELGLEALALGVGATDFVAAVVNLQSLDLPGVVSENGK